MKGAAHFGKGSPVSWLDKKVLSRNFRIHEGFLWEGVVRYAWCGVGTETENIGDLRRDVFDLPVLPSPAFALSFCLAFGRMDQPFCL